MQRQPGHPAEPGPAVYGPSEASFPRKWQAILLQLDPSDSSGAALPSQGLTEGLTIGTNSR